MREFSAAAVVVGTDVGGIDMMRPVGEDLKVYVHRAPIDMRTGRNGLAALAKEVMQVDPFSGALFIYVGRRYDSMKILSWDRNGFSVWWKKIESDEKFHWPRLLQEEVITLTVFVPFAVLYMGQPLRLDYLWAGLCLLGAVYFMFRASTG